MDFNKNIPSVGIGTGRIPIIKTKNIIIEALNNNYKLIDTGDNYKNEHIIGECLATTNYNDVMIITKYFGGKKYGDVNDLNVCFKKSLKLLRKEILDIYLIHMPGGCEFIKDDGWKYINNDDNYNYNTRINCWKEILNLKKKGLVKYIGVSNWNIEQINELYNLNLELPDVLEIEWCVCYRDFELLNYCKKHNITVIGYGNLRRFINFGKYKGSKTIFDKENYILLKMSLKYKTTISSLLLKWCIQHNVIVIPSTINSKHLKENIELLNNNFKIEDSDMNILNNLTQVIKGHSLHNLY